MCDATRSPNVAIVVDNLTSFVASFIVVSDMKTIAIPLAVPHRKPDVNDGAAIHVYRRHAARAIAEERWASAEIFLDRILELDPRHTEAWLMKGHLAHHCRHDADAAIRCYRKVITLCGFDADHPHLKRARQSLDHLLLRI